MTDCSPAWHCTPSMVCPVAALRRVASFGPDGTGTPSGPLEPAGGCTQVDDMEAGMAWRGTCGFLNWAGTPLEPPPTCVMITTAIATTASTPPTRMPMRMRFLRSSARRFSSARRWFSVLRWAFDCLPLVIGASA